MQPLKCTYVNEYVSLIFHWTHNSLFWRQVLFPEYQPHWYWQPRKKYIHYTYMALSLWL